MDIKWCDKTKKVLKLEWICVYYITSTPQAYVYFLIRKIVSLIYMLTATHEYMSLHKILVNIM